MGRLNNNIGRVLSEETKEKIKISKKGKTLTDEHKELLSQKIKGRKWWNNGVQTKHSVDCPGEGWVRGRTPFKLDHTPDKTVESGAMITE